MQSVILHFHRITGYTELKGTHSDHQNPSLGPAQHQSQERRPTPESIAQIFLELCQADVVATSLGRHYFGGSEVMRSLQTK